MNFENIRSLISERFDVEEDKITRDTDTVSYTHLDVYKRQCEHCGRQ